MGVSPMILHFEGVCPYDNSTKDPFHRWLWASFLSALGQRAVSLRQDGEAQQRLAERPLPQEVAEAGPDMVRPGETERERQP